MLEIVLIWTVFVKTFTLMAYIWWQFFFVSYSRYSAMVRVVRSQCFQWLAWHTVHTFHAFPCVCSVSFRVICRNVNVNTALTGGVLKSACLKCTREHASACAECIKRWRHLQCFQCRTLHVAFIAVQVSSVWELWKITGGWQIWGDGAEEGEVAERFGEGCPPSQ